MGDMNNSQGGLWHYLTLWTSNGLLLNNDKWGLIYGFSVAMLVYPQLAMNNSQSWVVALFYPHYGYRLWSTEHFSRLQTWTRARWACKLLQPMGCQNFGPADFGLSSNTGWWFQPLWKILVSSGYYSQYRKNKQIQTTNQNIASIANCWKYKNCWIYLLAIWWLEIQQL